MEATPAFLYNYEAAAPLPNPYDVDAKLFVDTIFINEGIQLTTAEIFAVNNLVLRMKGLDATYSNFGDATIWNERILFCPNVGNSLNATKYNLFNPLGWQQTYANGPTIDAGFGVKGNGVNSVILSGVSQRDYKNAIGPVIDTQNGLIGCIYKDNITTSRMDFGNYGTSPSIDANLWLRATDGTNISVAGRAYTLNDVISSPPTSVNGNWAIQMQNGLPNRGKYYYNGTLIHISNGANPRTIASEMAAPVGQFYFLALNLNNGIIVNSTANTAISYYVLGDIGALITPFNLMVDAFCAETNRKTW
jgi:hypothetical protein